MAENGMCEIQLQVFGELQRYDQLVTQHCEQRLTWSWDSTGVPCCETSHLARGDATQASIWNIADMSEDQTENENKIWLTEGWPRTRVISRSHNSECVTPEDWHISVVWCHYNITTSVPSCKWKWNELTSHQGKWRPHCFSKKSMRQKRTSVMYILDWFCIMKWSRATYLMPCWTKPVH